MIFIYFIFFCNSKEKESKVHQIVKEIKNISQNLSSIQFNRNDSTDRKDKDAINLVLMKTEILQKPNNILLRLRRRESSDYLKEKCSNCIKVLSNNVLFTFHSIRKSNVNTIKFYRSSSSCSIKTAQLFFYFDDIINYTTKIYDLEQKSLSTYHFERNITFDKVQLNATSLNPSMLCLSEFSLLFR